jgi:uncharacterized protein (UPF0248 family)
MPKAAFPRDILNRLRWEKGESLESVEIVILHRGAPGDRIRVRGGEVVSISHMFFDTKDTLIPFHRVLEIWHSGRKIFDRGEIRKNR